jgi:hypothetical protein
VSERRVVVRRGGHYGWWVDGRSARGSRFMLTWWPTERIARTVARWVGGRAEPDDSARPVDGSSSSE